MVAHRSLLLTYFMTNEPVYVRRMQNTIVQQKIVDDLNGSVPFAKVLITDAKKDAIPHDIRDFFSDNISEIAQPYVIDELTGAKECSRSALRNKCIAAGLASGCAWMMFCDVDTVIVVGKNFSLPETGYARPKLYMQRNGSEKVADSYRRVIESVDDSIFTSGNSWFILSRAIMEKVRANELMYGYGFQDMEFDARVHSLGYGFKEPPLYVIHIDHPHEQRGVKNHLMKRNEDLWNASCALLAAGIGQDNLPELAIYQVSHDPPWSICVSHERKIAVRAAERLVGEIVSDDLDGAGLMVKWKDNSMTTLRRTAARVLQDISGEGRRALRWMLRRYLSDRSGTTSPPLDRWRHLYALDNNPRQ